MGQPVVFLRDGRVVDHADLTELTPVPWRQLLVLALGLPVLATATGWLLAGREPAGFSRQTFD